MSTPVRLTDAERYGAFKELDLDAKVATGLVLKDVHDLPGPPKYIIPRGDLPPGTIGQEVLYHIRVQGGGTWTLVKAHQYRLPNGTVRGGPDPLFIRLHDVVLQRTERQVPRPS